LISPNWSVSGEICFLLLRLIFTVFWLLAHWKVNDYNRQVTLEVLSKLGYKVHSTF